MYDTTENISLYAIWSWQCRTVVLNVPRILVFLTESSAKCQDRDEAYDICTNDIIMHCMFRTVEHLRRCATVSCAAVVECWLEGENWRNLEVNLLQCHFEELTQPSMMRSQHVAAQTVARPVIFNAVTVCILSYVTSVGEIFYYCVCR